MNAERRGYDNMSIVQWRRLHARVHLPIVQRFGTMQLMHRWQEAGRLLEMRRTRESARLILRR